MTPYLQIGELLQSASQALPTVPAPTAQVAAWTAALPFAELTAGDEACQAWIATRQWPPLPAPVLAQIHLRLGLAKELCRLAVRQRKATLAVELPDALELMLVRFWHAQGIDWVKRTYG